MDEKKQISLALSFLAENQKIYGKDINIEMLVAGFEFAMADDFEVVQILHGMKIYMKTKSDMPAPADIINILKPQEARITEAEYVNAVKYQERHNWHDMFSDAQMVIDKYREQEKQDRGEKKKYNDEILKIAGNAVKRIGN